MSQPTAVPHTLSTAARRASTFGLRVAVLAAGSLLLAGCAAQPSATAPASATPTPTATFASGAPQSAAEATEAASAAVANFYTTTAAVQVGGGADLSPLATVATGPALDSITSDSTWLSDDTYTVSGAMTFSPTASTADDLVADNGETYPFGSVLVSGCQDSSAYLIAQNGEPFTLPIGPRTLFDYTVVFEPTTEAWLVQSIAGEDAVC